MIAKLVRRFLLGVDRLSGSATKKSTRFLAFIAIIGVALGVASLVIVTSVMNGFETEIRRTQTAFHGHILLFAKSKTISDPEKFKKDLLATSPDIVDAAAYLFTEGMLTHKKSMGVVLEGVDMDAVHKVSEISQRVISGRLPSVEGQNEIAIGSVIAEKLKLSLGSTVQFTVPFHDAEAVVKPLVVTGIVSLGMYEYDSKYAVTNLSTLQNILALPNQVNAFKILTRSAATSNQIASVLNEKYLYPIRARDWSTLNRNILYALALEKVVIGILLLAIVFVASFNVVSLVLMLVYEKRKSIAMLQAIGLRRSKIFQLWLLVGVLVASLGVFLGSILGLGGLFLLKHKTILDLPAQIYMFSKFPVEMRLTEIAVILIAALVIAVSATVWPSLRVSRRAIIDALKQD